MPVILTAPRIVWRIGFWSKLNWQEMSHDQGSSTEPAVLERG
jgi:hypothetical protein